MTDLSQVNKIDYYDIIDLESVARSGSFGLVRYGKILIENLRQKNHQNFAKHKDQYHKKAKKLKLKRQKQHHYHDLTKKSNHTFTGANQIYKHIAIKIPKLIDQHGHNFTKSQEMLNQEILMYHNICGDFYAFSDSKKKDRHEGQKFIVEFYGYANIPNETIPAGLRMKSF